MNLETIIHVAPDQVSCDLDGEAAILNLESGIYYGLDPVGARIWNVIQEPCTVASVRDVILAEYEVTAEVCERDLLDLLHKLAEEGLIKTVNESVA